MSLVLHSPRDAQRHGIAIIYQELNLIPELTVAENIYLGHELHNAAGLLDTAAMDRSRALLDAALPISTKRQVKTLRVRRAAARRGRNVSLDARLLILDEPTSAERGGDPPPLRRHRRAQGRRRHVDLHLPSSTRSSRSPIESPSCVTAPTSAR